MVGAARIKSLPLKPFITHSPPFPTSSPRLPLLLISLYRQPQLHNVGGSAMSMEFYNVCGSLQCPWFYNIRGCTTSPPKHFDSGKGFKVEYRFNGFRVRLRFMVRFRFKVRLTAMVKFG